MEPSLKTTIRRFRAIHILKTFACGFALLATPSIVMAADPAPAFETPSVEHVLTVRASVDAMVSMGKTPEGERRVVPITGGTFEGTGPAEGIKGTIMPGGEDWQLIRDDGVMQLDARYWLRTEDGAIIRVSNQVLSTIPPKDQPGTKRYMRSSVKFEAPIGKYEWLNKAIFVGTIMPDMSQKPPVIVLRFFKVN